MSWCRNVALTTILAVSAAASAFPPFWSTFEKTYKPTAGSAVASAKCAVCHVTAQGGSRNPFGRAVQGKLNGSLSAAILHGLDNEDSDGDGVPNLDEIKAGTLPGDPASKPPTAAGKPSAEPTTAAEPELVPKHTFHPVLVHFPLALFLFAAFLEILGARSQGTGLREAAKWNMFGAAASAWVSIPTGLIAANRLGYALTPGTVVFGHLVTGILSALLITGIALWRRKLIPTGPLYWLILLATSALIGFAGHLGGTLVYG